MQEILVVNAVDEFGRIGTAQKIGAISAEDFITVDNSLNDSSENPVRNSVITTALNAKSDKPTITTVTGTTPTITPEDNTIYECGELTSLTISNPPATGAYSIVFSSGSTAATTTIPDTILGLEDFTSSSNSLYEINVLNNRALVGDWEVAQNE